MNKKVMTSQHDVAATDDVQNDAPWESSVGTASALLETLLAVRRGDFSVRMRSDLTGVTGKIADTLNDIIAANQKMAAQLENVGQVVGRDGRTNTRVRFGLADGAWADMEGSINTLIDDLLWPTTAVTRTMTAVAKGDLLQTVPPRCRRSATQGRISPIRRNREYHDQTA